MKYIEKYDLYIDNDFVMYKIKNEKLVQINLRKNRDGYLTLSLKSKTKLFHRVLWEIFNFEIPKGYEIDHINTIRTDNRLKNLRCVTRKENCNNPITISHRKKLIWGDFAKKFFEHYGLKFTDNPKLYDREHHWYRYHNFKCRWEI